MAAEPLPLPFLQRNETMIKELSIDLETYSEIDIQKCGVYKYAESETFEILLFAYSVNNGLVNVVDLACGEEIPPEILKAITEPAVTKWAFNANFERICLSNWLHRNHPQYLATTYIDPTSWKCSMIWSAYLGLPLSLEGVGAVLKLENQKLKEGKDLIRYFCKPCAATKTNGGRTRNFPIHDLQKWEMFKSYNKRDVEVELAIQKKLSKFPVPDFLWNEYRLDQEINDKGIALDRTIVKEAIELDRITKDKLMNELKTITGLENPNSVLQMREWLSSKGLETDTLDKKAVGELLKKVPQELAEVLTLRQQLAKSSVKKYQAMGNAICSDGRAHGMFQFYGANRSGRWAGRLIQLQNLPQNHLPDLEEARNLVLDGNYESLAILYDSVPNVLSELIRTAFIPKSGYKFIVADFSAIEARVLAHLAGEAWRTNVFRNNGDIYCASASNMFGVPVEKHGINSHLRHKGKIAELALGYGGSVGALTSMGAIEMGIKEEELQPLVDAWRNANPNICSYWWEIDRAVKTAIKTKSSVTVNSILLFYKSGILFIKLPSGRTLAYVKPQIGENRFGRESVTYEGVDATKKWERIESYGPKFVENIVQAISRDILVYALQTLSHFHIVGHVHDEIILEVPMDTSLNEICKQMGKTPPWISGLLLRADGYETMFYKKE